MQPRIARITLACLIACSVMGCSEVTPRVGSLTVCLGEADPPRAVRLGGGSGFDWDVAQLLAERLNRNLEVVWQPEPVRTEIESTDFEFGPLLGGQCDLMLSVPGDDAIIGLQDRLALSQPYYGAGYEIIPEAGQLAPATKVAVRANTVAHVVIDARGHNWTMQPDAHAIVSAVKNGDADVGLIWGPDLALLGLELQMAGIAFNSQYEPPRILRWNQHAVLTKDHPLLPAINAALANSTPEIMDLLSLHNMPMHPPYSTTHQSQQLRDL